MKTFFKRKKKEGRDDVLSPWTSNASHGEVPYYYHRAEAQANESAKHSSDRINNVVLCLNLLSVCIALLPCKDLLILPCAEYKKHDQIVSAVLGPGHGAFLRGYVDGSDDQPILQGKETSLKRGSAVMARRIQKNIKIQKKVPRTFCV